jgi:hypothetical protein
MRFKTAIAAADEVVMELFITVAAVVTAVSCVTAAHTYLALAVEDAAQALQKPSGE